jgi:hopanoid biosynthesis associated RND transporter like protein HpnN
VVAVALAAASVFYALTTLRFATSTRALLPADAPYVLRHIEYDRQFGELDDIAIVVEAPSQTEAKAYASRLARELKAGEVPLRRITYRIDPAQFEGRALLYLSTERLREIRDKIFDYQEFLETFAGRPTLDGLVTGVATQIASGFVTGFLGLGLESPGSGLDVKFLRDLVDMIANRLDRPTPYRSPWSGLFTMPDAEDTAGAGYFLSDDERLLFILAEPESDEGSFTGNQRAIEGTRAVIAALAPEFPEVRVGVTGRPALANDERTAAFGDSETATLVAFVLTLALLVAAFLRVVKPVLMLLGLALSLCWSIGLATLVIGHLSLFSVMFISIVIGVGIDYGIYYLFRYEEEIFLGRNLQEAIEIAAARSGPGMLLGAVTASSTFYVLMLTDFRGLQELGFIAGSAILLGWLAMMLVLPAIIVLLDRRHADRPEGPIPRAMALERVRVPLVDWIVRRPRSVLAFAIVVTLFSILGLRGARFDYNLLNLQAEGTESVEWEKRVLATAGRSGFAALASADSLAELRRKAEAFARLPSVSEVDSALLLIPDQQEDKLRIIADFAPLVAPIRVGRPRRVDVAQLIEALETLRRRLTIAASEAPPGEAQRELTAITARVERLIIKLRQTAPSLSEPVLSHLQFQLYRDFVRSFQQLQASLAPRLVGLADVPDEIRRKFISDQGRFLLQIHPAVDIWEREGATRFVTDLRGVDPEVTGTPVVTFEAIRLMERAYQQGTLYAIILVAGVTAVMLRRPRLIALALLPLGLGMLWTVGLMTFLGLKFTLGNIFGLPLVLGAAAEYGLNVVIRFIEDREHGGPLIARSTIMAVLVNGLTTIAGFGSLMLAHHRGIFGLGLLMTLGAATSLVAALLVLPVMLQLVAGRRGPRAGAPRPSAPLTAAGSSSSGRIVALAITLAVAVPAAAAAGAPGLTVTLDQGRLSVRAEAAPLRAILAEISRTAGVTIRAEPAAEVELTGELTTVVLERLPLTEILRQLLRDRNYTLTYTPAGLAEVRIYRRPDTAARGPGRARVGSRAATAAEPGAEDEAARLARMQARAISDPDPDSRVEALEELDGADDGKVAITTAVQVLERDRHERVLDAALDILVKHDAVTVEPILRLASTDLPPDLRIRVLELLSEHGQGDARVGRLLRDVRDRDTHRAVRDSAESLLEDWDTGVDGGPAPSRSPGGPGSR